VKTTESTNRDEGSEYQVRCVACQNETRHHVLLSLKRSTEDGDWWRVETYQIIQCRGCGSPTFRYERTDPDSQQTDGETGESFSASEVSLYPYRDTKPELAKARFFPLGVQTVYREVLLAIGAHIPVLAAVGLRTLVEAACRDLGAAGNLKSMIEGLATKGILRAEEAEILHLLRDAGNASAHEARAFTQGELLNALTMVEHILTTVYLLPHHRRELPSKRTDEI